VNKRAEGRKRSRREAVGKSVRGIDKEEQGDARFNAHLAGHSPLKLMGESGGYREVFDVAAVVQTAQLSIRMAAGAFKADVEYVYAMVCVRGATG
jgi:hypothetical protein